MILDRKHFIFLVQAIDRGQMFLTLQDLQFRCQNGAGGNVEGRVLDILEFLMVRNSKMVRCWEPNGSCIHEKVPDKGLISDKNGFLLLTQLVPVGALSMLIRRKVRVTKDFTWALNLK